MRRTLVMALVLAVAALCLGIFVTVSTFPSDEDIQRLSLEEISKESPLLAEMLESPMIKGLLDQTFGEMQDRVRDRVLDESRDSMYLGAGATVLVMVAGVALIATDHRRRHQDD